LVNPSTKLKGWINTDFYEPTKEVIGVLPIPLEVQHTNRLSAYIESLQDLCDSDQRKNPNQHQFLTRLQGTWKAVLPVHTPAERKLFQELIQKNNDFEPMKGGLPNWEKAVQAWNHKADTNNGIQHVTQKPVRREAV
jgi:hypothetical protein